MSASREYAFIERTPGTVGLTATGRSLGELFVHTAQGLAELLVGESQVSAQDTRVIRLCGANARELLAAWLTELVRWFTADRFVPAVYHLDEAGRTELRGRIIGEPFNPDRHTAGTAVTGVARPQLDVTETPDGWAARVVFDVAPESGAT